MAIGDVRFELLKKVSLTTSESDTGVSRLAKADERQCNSSGAQSNLTAPAKNKRPVLVTGFLFLLGVKLGSNF